MFSLHFAALNNSTWRRFNKRPKGINPRTITLQPDAYALFNNNESVVQIITRHISGGWCIDWFFNPYNIYIFRRPKTKFQVWGAFCASLLYQRLLVSIICVNKCCRPIPCKTARHSLLCFGAPGPKPICVRLCCAATKLYMLKVRVSDVRATTSQIARIAHFPARSRLASLYCSSRCQCDLGVDVCI